MKCIEQVSKKILCITTIMDHVVSESKRVYEGTSRFDDFCIFHDGLSQWWEEGSQNYLHSLGFRDRQLRAYGDTNQGTRYFRKVVGDSPELCRGLDSHGFADLVRSMIFHTVLTSSYAVTDARRFKLGTPAEVEDCMRRCWTLEPTSARIVEDVQAFERVLGLIVEAKGCVVPDEATRHGRRVRKANAPADMADEDLADTHWCTKKPRVSQRKATLHKAIPPIHADAQAAFDNLMGDDFDGIMDIIPGVAATFGVL